MGEADVEVRAGIPDTGIVSRTDGRAAYPGTAIDVVKLLQERQLKVEWHDPKEDRVSIEHKAAEIWLPVLSFLGGACANAAGTIFAQIILDLFGKDAAKDHILHVEFQTGKGENQRKFKATGLGRDVLKAMQEFDDHDALDTEEFDTGEGD